MMPRWLVAAVVLSQPVLLVLLALWVMSLIPAPPPLEVQAVRVA